MKKEVLVVFKTHLDIGYTDYSENVINNYINTFIPNAIKVGNALKGTDTPFIWTVGSWLIWEALKRDKDGSLEKAIKDGIISWHGLPFTSHTELMNKELFEYGLSLSKKLDEKFGTTTIGAKMTDVPGHTIGMVPLMKKSGLKFLHIGVNGATPVPEVPSVFRWKCHDDEIVVMYGDGYGKDQEFDDFIICFGHTNDNMGPQSPDEIIALYDKLKAKYPDCTIRAATLNDVAEKILTLKDLPVVENEIGDTWIHGAGTDPKKVGIYRELLRYIEKNGIGNKDISDNLLLVPEHTCGMNICVYYNNTKDWYYDDFKNSADTDKKKYIEHSWNEQRAYLKKAENLLGTCADYTLAEPDLSDYTEAEDRDIDIQISWQLFDIFDYNRYIKKYVVINDQTYRWASWDFTKLGLPIYNGGKYNSEVTACYRNGEKKLYKLEFDKELAEKHGLPHFWVTVDGGKIDIEWFGKGANRLPQAFWLKFKGYDEKWEIDKLGEWIDPETIIGSPLITATYTGIRNKDVEIISKDACLVAPFGRKLLDFGKAPSEQNLYFNLYNNIWNTNFPMWYSDDTRFRFEIKKRK